jgi:ketosteroid isomerase-like protein
MSEENLQTARAAIDALNRRDVEEYLGYCTADVELVPANAAVEGAYAGEEGIRRFLADAADAGPDFHLEPEHIEAVAPDRVIAFLRLTATGRASGVPADQEVTSIYDFRDGRMRRIRVFLDRREALAAARAT